MEEELMYFGSVPSLESIATVNIAVALFKESSIRSLIIKHLSLRECREMLKSSLLLEDSIIQNASDLPLPPVLKAEVFNIINPIKLQILEWIRNREDVEYFDCIHWTVEGKINKEKTLKQLIDRDSGDSKINYTLSCHYCLEDCISKAWNKLQEETKKEYRSSSPYSHMLYDEHLEGYWNHVVRNELPSLMNKLIAYDEKNIYNCSDSIYKNMFVLSLETGNIMAVKYFWKKFTVNEISGNLVQWIDDVIEKVKEDYIIYGETNGYSDILFFLLSQMTDWGEQRQVFLKYSELVLRFLFLVWPWQRFLLPTLQLMVDILDSNSFFHLWSLAGEQVRENKIPEKFFRKIWNISPISVRKFYIRETASNSDYPYEGEELLCSLLLVEDTEMMEALSYANTEERKILMFKAMKTHTLSQAIYQKKLSLLDKLLESTLQLGPEVKNMKQEIIQRHFRSVCQRWIKDDDFKMIEEFLQWGYTSLDEINNFMNKIDKTEMVYNLLQGKVNYEVVDKFLNWCYVSQLEVNAFKKRFALSKCNIIKTAHGDWCFFQKYVDWCFSCEEDINIFKQRIIEDYTIVSDVITSGYHYEFADRLIYWCCTSTKKVKKYKERFVLSQKWIDILLFDRYSEHEERARELTKGLINLFSPLSEKVIIKLKNKIDFGNYNFNYIKKVDLFRMIDRASCK